MEMLITSQRRRCNQRVSIQFPSGNTSTEKHVFPVKINSFILIHTFILLPRGLHYGELLAEMTHRIIRRIRRICKDCLTYSKELVSSGDPPPGAGTQLKSILFDLENTFLTRFSLSELLLFLYLLCIFSLSIYLFLLFYISFIIYFIN